MDIKKTVWDLMQYVREGEMCSCPYLIKEGENSRLGIFTYYGTNGSPLTVYGFGQVISSDGETVSAEQRDLFQSEKENIIITDTNHMTAEKRNQLYESYYCALQNYVDKKGDIIKAKKDVKEAFDKIVKGDARELYRRICPDFLSEFSV